jgi:hypothetical protein
MASALMLMFFMVPNSLYAQNLSYGIKGGLNLSTLTVADADDSNIIPGFHAGLFADIFVADKVSIGPEIHFSTKGVKATYDANLLGLNLATGETRLDLYYVDIPVYVKYYLSEDFNFHLGPYAGMLTKAKIETDAELLDFIEVDDSENMDREVFNTLDYGVSMGLGFIVEPVRIGFNYNLGLNRVAKEDDSMESLLGDAKNNVIQVYLGFSF